MCTCVHACVCVCTNVCMYTYRYTRIHTLRRGGDTYIHRHIHTRTLHRAWVGVGTLACVCMMYMCASLRVYDVYMNVCVYL